MWKKEMNTFSNILRNRKLFLNVKLTITLFFFRLRKQNSFLINMTVIFNKYVAVRIN